MARKVFLSFLGITNYHLCNYYVEHEGEALGIVSNFAQEAILKKCCPDFSESDELIIFLTEESKINWSREHDPNANEDKKFLKDSLDALGLQAQIRTVIIPQGKSKTEFWNIFEIIFNQLQNQDELYLDLTLGYRTLPVLAVELMNYCKIIKQVTVAGVFYGNLDMNSGLEGRPKNAEIWNLKSLSDLQDWANSLAIFKNTGISFPLSAMMHHQGFTELSDNLDAFSKMLLVNRGVQIIDGRPMLSIKNELIKAENNFKNENLPLKHIFNQVGKEFDMYEEKDYLNGMHAVRWCLRNGMIQQAITLLEETIINFLMIEMNLDEKIKVYDCRKFVSDIIYYNGKEKYSESQNNNKQLVYWKKEVLENLGVIKERWSLSKILKEIKLLRNDVNHAGMNLNEKTYNDFKLGVVTQYNKFSVYLQKHIKIQNISI